MTSVLKLLVFLLIFLNHEASGRFGSDNEKYNWYEKNRLKLKCLKKDDPSGRNSVRLCWFWEGMKSWFRRSSISWFPGKTKEWNLTELTDHCNDYYVCMENTKCYKDYVLFETLDRCSHDAFSIGPMSFCNKNLKDFNKNSPGNLPSCVVDYLEKDASKKWTCENTKSLGDCLLPQVQKHCDAGLLPIFHEHQAARQYYLGCDGKLKFKDLESNSTAIANNFNATNSTEIEIL
ncbi:unnamed protein product [Caenorhabditis nigoni]